MLTALQTGITWRFKLLSLSLPYRRPHPYAPPTFLFINLPIWHWLLSSTSSLPPSLSPCPQEHLVFKLRLHLTSTKYLWVICNYIVWLSDPHLISLLTNIVYDVIRQSPLKSKWYHVFHTLSKTIWVLCYTVQFTELVQRKKGHFAWSVSCSFFIFTFVLLRTQSSFSLRVYVNQSAFNQLINKREGIHGAHQTSRT